MEITSDEVRNVLRMLKEDKSPGPDKISTRLIIHLIDELCEPLSMLFEDSLEEQRVPDDWRNADIVPIFKTSTRSKPEDYKPVSLTRRRSCLTNILTFMEKVTDVLDNQCK
jgi:hypothetical protein